MNGGPLRVDTAERPLSRWLTLVETAVSWPGRKAPDVYHSFAQADYVSVLAVTRDGRFPLVRQYRPGCGAMTLELPGGMLEAGEEPAECMARELREEVGCGGGMLTSLGTLWPDPGRLRNRLHCFFATGLESPPADWQPEEGLEPCFVDAAELRRLVATGALCNAHHVAIVGLAQAAGAFRI
jgi:ADP-ribose pyrophosphatase